MLNNSSLPNAVKACTSELLLVLFSMWGASLAIPRWQSIKQIIHKVPLFNRGNRGLISGNLQKRMEAMQALCHESTRLLLQLPCRYVCGIAKCSLAGLATGVKQLELHSNVMPYTTVRGAAGLEWSSRPGRYVEVSHCLQAMSQLSYACGSAYGTLCKCLPRSDKAHGGRSSLRSARMRHAVCIDMCDAHVVQPIFSLL